MPPLLRLRITRPTAVAVFRQRSSSWMLELSSAGV
jgi:hypothetical protein